MSDKFFSIIFSTVVFAAFVAAGCSVEAAKSEPPKTAAVVTESSQKPSTIEIEPNSPADTVRAFYKHLREKKFREAIFLTNLRPAIEGLTDTEMKDLQIDFEALAAEVPAEIEINGEIISGDRAAVTVNLPNLVTKKDEVQNIKLYREADVWIIQTVDGEAEKLVKKEGKNYFFVVRIEAHHEEAKEMFDRIMKAQMVYALQNKGVYADTSTLVQNNFLPADVINKAVAGYNYKIFLSADKTKYAATAEPAIYGKTGKLSFLVEAENGKNPRMTSRDNGGQPLKKTIN